MKKLFILAAAIVAFASCSKEPEAIVNDGSIYFTSAQTRATGITDIATLAENNFKVYAYTTGENGYDVYAGVEAIAENKTNTTEATIWKPTAVKYWAENETYNFLGLYPKELTASVDKKNSKSTVEFTNDGLTDVVVATAGRNVETDLNQVAVPMLFKHQLARVAFTFVNQFSTDQGFTVKVSNVKLLNVLKSATFTYDYSDIDNIKTGITEGSERISLSYTFDNNAGDAIAANNGAATTVYLYTIPEGVREYYISYTVEIYNGTELINKFVADETTGAKLTLGTDAKDGFVAGKGYVFTANVYDVVNPITFTVKVENWSDVTDAGTITIGEEKNNN